jgi:hypothetical protein
VGPGHTRHDLLLLLLLLLLLCMSMSGDQVPGAQLVRLSARRCVSGPLQHWGPLQHLGRFLGRSGAAGVGNTARTAGCDL